MILQTSSTSSEHTGVAFIIEGEVEQPFEVTIGQLLSMDVVEQQNLLHACGSGEPKGHIKKIRGILLTDVIGMAQVRIIDHDDTKKMFVSVASDDGYKTVFSWQELFNTTVGNGVIVVLEKRVVKSMKSMAM